MEIFINEDLWFTLYNGGDSNYRRAFAFFYVQNFVINFKSFVFIIVRYLKSETFLFSIIVYFNLVFIHIFIWGRRGATVVGSFPIRVIPPNYNLLIIPIFSLW